MINWPTSSPVNEPVVLNGLPDEFFRQNNVLREKYTAECLEDHPELKSTTNPADLDPATLSYQFRWTKGGTTTTVAKFHVLPLMAHCNGFLHHLWCTFAVDDAP